MNKTYTFFTLFITCLFSTALLAQPTLTTANNPVPNQLYKYQTPSPTGFNPGVSGANITWNFGNLNPDNAAIEGQAIAANQASTGNMYPNATVAIVEANGTETYYYGDTDGQGFYGAMSSSGGTTAGVNYTDPQDLIQYPMTYNNSFSDSFSGTVGASGSSFNRSGTATVAADGHGTLITPAGTFTNVLRLKTNMTYSDQVAGQTIVAYTEERYTWYDASSAYPLLTYTILTANGATSAFVNYLDASAVSIEEVVINTTADLSIKPNPATDFANLNFELLKSADVQVTVFNLIGQEKIVIPNRNFNKGKNQIDINLDQLSSGTYFVRLDIDGNVVTRKLVVK